MRLPKLLLELGRAIRDEGRDVNKRDEVCVVPGEYSLDVSGHAIHPSVGMRPVTEGSSVRASTIPRQWKRRSVLPL
jgi:hypothetical protein